MEQKKKETTHHIFYHSGNTAYRRYPDRDIPDPDIFFYAVSGGSCSNCYRRLSFCGVCIDDILFSGLYAAPFRGISYPAVSI